MKKLVVILSIVLSMNIISAQQQFTITKVDSLKNFDDKLNYALGVDIANSIKNLGIKINADLIYQGIVANLTNDPNALLTQKDVPLVFQEFQTIKQQEQQKQQEEMAKPNVEAGKKYLDSLIKADKKKLIKVTSSGLGYQVIKEAKGQKPLATDKVKVNYKGMLIDGRVFDENKTGISFPLNGVIQGWTEGLQLMSVGSTYRFYIPAYLAYGNMPPQGSIIQAGSMLVFDVELLGVNIE